MKSILTVILLIVTTTLSAQEFVDLGLSVKWATCNLGANSPEEFGDYYAWGETKKKLLYSSDNSTTHGKSISELRSAGVIDTNNNLTAKYDAATKNLGNSYRMPTKEEMEELVDSCTWVWSSYNGINGYYVESKNGNCIFLPATGYCHNTDCTGIGSYGFYWCSTGNDLDYNGAYHLHFISSYHDVYYPSRQNGQSVRPVAE